MATSIVRGEMMVAGHRHPWALRNVRKIKVRGEKGPWLVLVAACAGESGRVVIEAAYAYPILASDCWFPTESEYERRVTRLVFEFVKCCRAGGLNVSVQKPYWPILLDGLRTYPDLVLSFEGGTVMLHIEVLGSDSAAYLAEKEAQAVRLRRNGQYHAVKAYLARDVDDLWKKEEALLLAALNKWLSAARTKSSSVVHN